MTSRATIIPPGLKKVPPFPPIAARLLALMANPSAEVAEIAELVRSDATFTARVLQLANSAAFCFPSAIESVDHAIALMGRDRTRDLVVLYGAGAYTSGALRTAEMRTCWQHSIATAVIAEEIAKCCGMFTTSAFTAGIMHDIGRLGLLAAYPDEYEYVIRASVEQCIDILDFEREKFGVHHAEAGLLLAQQWGLPSEFQMIAGRHHDPCEGFEIDLLKIVHVACRAAQVLGYDLVHPLLPIHLDKVFEELPPAARKRLEVSPERLSVQIESRILEYDREDADHTNQPLTTSGATEVSGAFEQPSEPQIESDTLAAGQTHTAPSSSRIPIAVFMLLVVIFAAVLLLTFQRVQ